MTSKGRGANYNTWVMLGKVAKPIGFSLSSFQTSILPLSYFFFNNKGALSSLTVLTKREELSRDKKPDDSQESRVYLMELLKLLSEQISHISEENMIKNIHCWDSLGKEDSCLSCEMRKERFRIRITHSVGVKKLVGFKSNESLFSSKH